MKRAFTLLEIVITLMVIGIALTMVSSLGQGFSDRIRFANAKEEIAQAVYNVVQEAATTNTVWIGTWQQKYGTLTLEILSGSTLQSTYASGELTAPYIRQTRLSQWRIATSWFNLTLHPYAIGCEVNGWNYTVSLPTNLNLKACYSTDPMTCKIREVPCP